MRLRKLGLASAVLIAHVFATVVMANGEGIGYQPTGYTEVCASTRLPIVTSTEGLSQVGNQGIWKNAQGKLFYYAGTAAGGIQSAVNVAIKAGSFVFGACMAFDALAFESRAEEFYPPIDSYCAREAEFFQRQIIRFRMYNIPDPLKPQMFNAFWANQAESSVMALLVCQEKFGSEYDPEQILDKAIEIADALTKASR